MSETTRMEYLGGYAEGWTKGDVERILEHTTPDYLFFDPAVAKYGVNKSQFPKYFTAELQCPKGLETVVPEFMTLSEVITKDDGNVLTAWCWWRINWIKIEGAGVIKVTDDGVVSEKIAYFRHLRV